MAHKANQKIMKSILTIFFSLMLLTSFAQQKIIVSADGKGNFKTVQEAINSLTDSAAQPRTIFIKNGTYNEKIFIEKSNIIFEGESKEKTILTNAIARDEWRCEHKDDWGVATMNVNGNDITFKNLSIVNSYGFDNKSERVVYCKDDTSATHMKTIRPNGHQMALRTMKATRLRAINCSFRAFAGDTVSPWNLEDGMFYFKDCDMEGGVDFYCPRGWAYAENCTFTANTGPACIWHDGSKYKDSKTVLVNCNFKGFDGFNLGRYHRDAQFYLVNCNFAANMADKDIYLVPTDNKIQWGRRIYFSNCHKAGGDYKWFADNLSSAEEKVDAKDITTKWVFGNRWDPLKN